MLPCRNGFSLEALSLLLLVLTEEDQSCVTRSGNVKSVQGVTARFVAWVVGTCRLQPDCYGALPCWGRDRNLSAREPSSGADSLCGFQPGKDSGSNPANETRPHTRQARLDLLAISPPMHIGIVLIDRQLEDSPDRRKENPTMI